MQDISRAGKYVLFLGAGASNAFGTPDMAKLFDACDHAVRTHSVQDKGGDWRREECALWQVLTEQDETRDLEAILRSLEVLSAEAFPGAFSAACSLASIATAQGRGRLPAISQQARNLHEFITTEIVRLLQPNPVAQRLGSYEQLLYPLRGLGAALVATTNYDTNLEQCAPELQLYDGFDVSGKWVGYPDADLRDGVAWRVDLAKLHGSVNWYALPSVPEPEVHRSGLAVGARPRGADGMPCQPYLILPPALKDRASDRVAASLRERLWRGFMQAELIVLVGYSLRDAYVREMLHYALERNTDLSLLLVGPDAEDIRARHFVDLFTEQVHAVTASFGDQSFEGLLASALRERVGIRIVEPPSTQRIPFRSRDWTPVPESAFMESDARSLSGKAIIVREPQDPTGTNLVLWGPYGRLEDPGRYTAFFRIRAEGADVLPASRDIIVLEVAARQAPKVATDDQAHAVEQRAVRAEDLQPCDQFVTLSVDFDWDLNLWDHSSLELRIFVVPYGPHSKGLSEMRIDTRWVKYIGPLRRKVWVLPDRG